MPYTHHKVKNKQCVYKKSTGKKVGCTTGPVKKYLAALHINANKGESVGTFKEHFFNTAQGDQIVTDKQHNSIKKQDVSVAISKESVKKLYEILISSLNSSVTEGKKRRKKARKTRRGFGGYYPNYGYYGGWGAGASSGSGSDSGEGGNGDGSGGDGGVAEGSLNESADEEAWELISQPVPEIQQFVKQLGLAQDDTTDKQRWHTAKQIAPMIDATPDTQLPVASIPKLKNLANKGNDLQTLKAIQQISGRPDAAQQYAKIMQARDAGEGRKRGYKVSGLINSVKSGNYEAPVLLKLATGTYVIGGRTRLYAALALGIPVKVKIISGSTFAKQGQQGGGGGGGESYHGMKESLTPSDIHKLADRKGIKWDNEPSFLQLTKRLTGKEHLDDLDQADLQKVKQYLQKQNIKEATYADGQDETTPSVQTLIDDVDKEQLIRDIINDLEDLKTSHDWSQPLGDDLIKAMADTLRDAGIEPTDFDAAISASPDKQEQYLIYGPSSWKGGQGALKDLKAIAAGNEPQEVKEDEANPASDLPAGSTTAGDPLSESTYKVGTVIFNNPFGTGRRYYQGTDKIEAASEDDALNKFVRFLARRENIPTNPRILYRDAQRNGARVIKLASSEPPVSDKPPQEYWWNKQ